MQDKEKSLISQLNDAFCALPGVGKKTAQRYIYYLLNNNKKAQNLTNILQISLQEIDNCQYCKAFTENKICNICDNDKRDKTKLCIVEMPVDIEYIEKTNSYNGVYFVLMGYLSPIDGITTENLNLDLLEKILAKQEIKEVILATNATTEGEVTANYVCQMVQKYNIKATKIARGIPIGIELEYIDVTTLAHAFQYRNK